MSDSWIILLPSTPGLVPDAQQIVRAEDLMREFTKSPTGVRSEIRERIQFIDAGENFSAVYCPSCGAEIATRWWSGKMDEDYEGGFRLEPIITPCCGFSTSLAGLRYDWPQGFARFTLESMNPGVGTLSDTQIAAIEAVVGTRLSMVRRHI